MRNKLLLFVLLLGLMGCKKDPVLIKSGIETNVFGTITDDHSEPISNLKIKVAEYKVTNTGSYIVSYEDYEFIKWVDSTNTDTNGNYNFVFKTSGKGNFYNMVIGEEVKPDRPQILFSEYYVPITQEANDMTYIGKQFEFNSDDLIRLSPCRITFKVNNVETFPIRISHEYTRAFNLKDLTANGTSEQTIYIQRYNKETVILFRMKNGVGQRATFEFPASNVKEMTYQTITVQEADFKNEK